MLRLLFSGYPYFVWVHNKSLAQGRTPLMLSSVAYSYVAGTIPTQSVWIVLNVEELLGWIPSLRLFNSCGSVFFFSPNIFHVSWACGALAVALRQPSNQRIFQRYCPQVIRLACIRLYPCTFIQLQWVISPVWTERRCFSTDAKYRRCSSPASSSAQFTPSKNAAGSFVETTRSAACTETTPPKPPVASDSWTRLTTTSPWSPGNFPGCWFCCFSSRWDTLCTERCAPDPGSSARRPTDSRPPPRHKNRSWRAARRTASRHRPRLPICPRTRSANASRPTKRRCGKAAMDNSLLLLLLLWHRLHDEAKWLVTDRHMRLCFLWSGFMRNTRNDLLLL